MRKLTLFCLALCAMAFYALPLRANDIVSIDGITYYLHTGTKVAYVMAKNGTGGNNPSNWYVGDIVINSSVKYEDQKYTVKGTCPDAFLGCANLTSVTLPNTVDSIGPGSFDYCTSLTSVNIPNGVRTIKNATFRNCSALREITIPASVEYIDGWAFEGCEFNRFNVQSQKVLAQTGGYTFSAALAIAKIHHFTFGGDVHTIPEKVLEKYNNRGITWNNVPSRYKVTLKDEVTDIHALAFENCPCLKSLVLSKNLAISGHAAYLSLCKLDSLTIQNQITVDAFGNPSGSNTDSVAHLILKGNTITSLPKYFGLHPKNTLETVTLPKNLETINDYAFQGCTSLREVKFSGDANALKTIGDKAFEKTAITTFAGSSALETIGESAFSQCQQLVSVSNLSSLKTLGKQAFYGCENLTEISPLNNLTSMGESAFEECKKLSEISFAFVPEIKAKTFYKCSALENVNIGIASVIADDAFYYCKAIASLTAGSDNTAFASQGGVLYNKNKSELVKLPPAKESYTFLSSVTSIRNAKAFEYCKASCAITILNETPPTQPETNGIFWRADGIVDVYAPEAALEAYMTAWGTMKANYHALQNGTCTVNGITYQYQSDGTATVIASSPKYTGDIVIPETFTYGGKTYRVTELGFDAFAQCTGLTSVSLPNSLVKIGISFNKCTGLTSITIPENVSYIASYAFMNCSNLQTIYCKPYRSVPSIDGTAFDLSNDVLIYVPAILLDDYKARWSGMTNIQAEPIERNGIYYSLNMNNLNASVIQHPDGAGGYNPLVDIVVPESIEAYGQTFSVDTIGKDAFYGCDEIRTISLPNSVVCIEEYAFYSCSILNTINIPENVTSIGQRAFWDCKTLSTIIIPAKVTTLGDWAFYNCTGLMSITSKATTPPTCIYKCFDKVDKSIPVNVPKESVADYKNTNEWKDFSRIIALVETCADVNTAPADSKVIFANPVSVAFVSGRYVYIQDETSTTLLYLNAANEAIYAGAKIAGIEGGVILYSGLPEVKPTNDVSQWTITADGTEPFIKTITAVPMDRDINQLVKIENVSIEAEFVSSKSTEINLPMADGEIILRNQFRLAYAFVAEKRYDILAAVATNNGTKKLYFLGVAAEHDAPDPQGIEDVQSDKVQCTKVLRDGKIFIIRDGKTYTVTGQMVK